MNTNALPSEAISIYNRALENTNRGKYSLALNEYQQAIKMYPYFIEAYNNMGEIYSIMGDREMAISTYTKALGIKKNCKILLNLGVEYYNTSNYEKALEFFLDSVSQDQNFTEGHYYCGLASHNLQDFKTAEHHLQKVVSFDSKHQKANYLLSHIYYEWKEYQKVLTCLDRIWNYFEDKSFLNKYYGLCSYHLGNFKEAEKYLTVALETRPEYAKFKKYLKNLTYENKLNELGDIDKTIALLEEELVSRKPELRDITKLSMLYIFKGENEKAENIASQFKETMSHNG